MNRDSDLAKAFAYSRRRSGPYSSPLRPAVLALQAARALVAALPALEAEEAAARAALDVQRAIDGRRHAPGMEKARADLEKASKAAQAGRRFKYAGPVWRAGPSGTWQGKPGLYYVEKADSLFRNVSPAADQLTGRDVAQGFYCDSFQEALCVAYVAQLRGRDGRAQYAPAYQFSESDAGGMTLDLGQIVESDAEAEREAARRSIGKAYWTQAMESPGYWAEAAGESALKEAARIAQGLAESAAEEERAYSDAWQAGSLWQSKQEEEQEARKEALGLLAERRELIKAGGPAIPAPAICRVLRAEVAGLWRSIQESRKARAALAEGDAEDSYWDSREERLRAAFCDGAGLAGFPN